MNHRTTVPAIVLFVLVGAALVCFMNWFGRQNASPIWLIAGFFLHAASFLVWRLALKPPSK